MVLVDSHCHFNMLDLSQQAHGIQTVLERADALGVKYFLNVGTEPSNWSEILELAEKYSEIFASIGLHPSDACEPEPEFETLLQFARHPKVVGIGETGLDYYHIEITRELQQERFRKHIQVAKTLKKPLIIHTRQAQEDTLKILREESAAEVGGVLHCFTEGYEMAKQAMDLNFKISFSGILTFKKALELKEVAQKVPLDYLLVETDAPFLTPEPFRGKANEPGYVFYVAKYLAELRQESMERIAEITTKNFFQLFVRDERYAIREKKH